MYGQSVGSRVALVGRRLIDNTLTPAIDDAKQYKDSYIGKPIGLKTTHKYRAKNKFGGYEIYEYIFGFDKNISTIIIVEDNLK